MPTSKLFKEDGTALLLEDGTSFLLQEPTFAEQRREIIDAFIGSLSEADDWDAFKATIPVTALTRTSNTVATLVIPAGTYDISADETISLPALPALAVLSRKSYPATPSFVISVGAAVVALDAAIAGAATLSATLTAYRPLNATIQGAAVVTAVATAQRPLTASIQGAGILSGGLIGVSLLSPAQINGLATLVGPLTATRLLSAAINGAGSLAGAISAAINLAATINGLATLTGSMTARRQLAAQINGAGSLSGLLIGLSSFAPAQINGAGSLSGLLTRLTALSPAAIFGVGTLNGDFASTGGIVLLSANINGAGLLNASIQGVRDLGAIAISGLGTLTGTLQRRRGMFPVTISGRGAILSGTKTFATPAFRGTPKVISAVDGAAVTLTFDVGAGAPQTGDVVLLFGGRGNSADADAWGPATAGYTLLQSVDINDNTPKVGLWYKVMGAIPDVDVTTIPSANVAHGVAYLAFVLDGSTVDTSNLLDGPITTFYSVLANSVDAPNVVTQTPGALVLALGWARSNDVSRGTVSAYTLIAGTAVNETDPIGIDAFYTRITTPGSEDPQMWGDWPIAASAPHGAFSVAIRPKQLSGYDALTALVNLQSSIQGVGALSGNLTAIGGVPIVLLSGLIQGAGIVSAALTAESRIVAAINGSGILSGTLTRRQALAALIAGQGTFSAEMKALIGLNALIEGLGSLSGAITAPIRIVFGPEPYLLLLAPSVTKLLLDPDETSLILDTDKVLFEESDTNVLFDANSTSMVLT